MTSLNLWTTTTITTCYRDSNFGAWNFPNSDALVGTCSLPSYQDRGCIFDTSLPQPRNTGDAIGLGLPPMGIFTLDIFPGFVPKTNWNYTLLRIEVLLLKRAPAHNSVALRSDNYNVELFGHVWSTGWSLAAVMHWSFLGQQRQAPGIR